jgi:nitrate/nitrite transport system substrate-binding protein
MASVVGFDKKQGVTLISSNEASAAAVRDKMVSGELDFAHALYGMVYGVHLSTSGPKRDMAILMTLNNNGQAITLS